MLPDRYSIDARAVLRADLHWNRLCALARRTGIMCVVLLHIGLHSCEALNTCWIDRFEKHFFALLIYGFE